MENQIYNSSVIVENYQVHYSYKRKPPSKSLNPMGNFYKFVHQQKQIQRFLEAYFLADGKPKVGDEICFDTQPSKITITKIDENYVRSESEQELYEVEEEFKRIKNKIKNSGIIGKEKYGKIWQEKFGDEQVQWYEKMHNS